MVSNYCQTQFFTDTSLNTELSNCKNYINYVYKRHLEISPVEKIANNIKI